MAQCMISYQRFIPGGGITNSPNQTPGGYEIDQHSH